MTFDRRAENENRRRLQEATCWCLARHPIRDPRRDLRTPDLKPSIDEWPTFAELDAAVTLLASRRRGSLGGRVDAEDRGGRVLVCEFNSSITSGESEEVTNGFLDVSDRPPWDTWMFCTQRKTKGSTSSDDPLDLLVSWVPSSLVASVERGISVNPYDCIHWAAEKDLHEWGLAE
jgi:hypothetical protein